MFIKVLSVLCVSIHRQLNNISFQVAIDLGTDHIPDELLCSTHPVLMFNSGITKGFAEIEKAIGKDKLYSSVLVNATTSHDTAYEQCLDVVMRLISRDFESKPWNYSDKFQRHILP